MPYLVRVHHTNHFGQGLRLPASKLVNPALKLGKGLGIGIPGGRLLSIPNLFRKQWAELIENPLVKNVFLEHPHPEWLAVSRRPTT
ncbi:MAG: hypothetical protein KatS3mg024_1540 [Armatimonadota bacterium]|nr:MAG: hypothetical protein KatS3mg024_1540 [Armatimonadota bacterium]